MVKINAAEAKLLSLLVPTKERCGDDVFSEANPEVNVTQVSFDRRRNHWDFFPYWFIIRSVTDKSL